MRKVVLGIALVLCLDVAFILMISNESGETEIARAVAPAITAPMVHQPQPQYLTEAVEDNVEPLERSPSAPMFRSKRRETPERTQRTQPTGAYLAEGPLPGEIKNLFPDTIIFIGKTDVSIEASDREPLPVQNETADKAELQASPRTERDVRKRSFPSRAFGVVKKPYEWVKTLAAKLR